MEVVDRCYIESAISGIVKRISERPDVKSAHIEGKDTRNRSRISLNITKE